MNNVFTLVYLTVSKQRPHEVVYTWPLKEFFILCFKLALLRKLAFTIPNQTTSTLKKNGFKEIYFYKVFSQYRVTS